MSGGGYEIALAKEDFKFSVAHFTIFGKERGERLHGHNYDVSVRVGGARTNELGLLLNIEDLKRDIRRLCSRLDEKTLVPTASSVVGVEPTEDGVEVRFAGRQYRFPEADVLLLPIKNTSIEELALYIWRELAPGLESEGVDRLTVEVGETPGQSCSYTALLSTESGERELGC